MKKIAFVLVVLMCVSMSMTAYAQSEPDFDDPDWYKVYGYEADPRIENPDWTIDEITNGNTSSGNDVPVDDVIQDSAPRLADGIQGRGTLENPFEYWEANGYPDNISFAAEGGGENDNGVNIIYWVIGIVNADEKSKQEIIDLVSPNSRITFENCIYSYSQRETAYNTILAMKDTNILDVIFILNTENIQVIVSEDNVGKYAETLVAQFGSMIWVTDESGVGYDNSGGIDILIPPKANNLNNWILPAMLMLLCGVAVIVYFNRSRLIHAMQTANGNIVTGNAPVSRKQTIAIIKNSAITPPDNVFNSIMAKIEKAQK